jgi:protein-disulfide isomerase
VSNRFFAILIIIIAVIGGVIFVSNSRDDTPSAGDTPPTNIVYNDSVSTAVTLVEYADFQCPVCAQYHPIMDQVKEKYGDQITIQFRHFPLSEIHPNAVLAHRSSMAAYNQDKFWEYHDLLFENQATWSASTNVQPFFDGYAEQLGLDMDRFRADVASSETNSQVQADRAEAQRRGYTGTPTFELDGNKLDPSPTSFEEFSSKIDEAIKAKSAN